MLLLRHGTAGERLSEPTLDAVRPLDLRGWEQAEGLRATLASYRIERVVSSPLLRCVQTVEPLADDLGLEIEKRIELEPKAARVDLLRLLRELPSTALVCTHREVFQMLFGTRFRCEKGAAWVIERRVGRWWPLAYVPPPDALADAATARSAVRSSL